MMTHFKLPILSGCIAILSAFSFANVAKADFIPVISADSSEISTAHNLLDGITSQAPGWDTHKDDADPWVAIDLTSSSGAGQLDNSTVNVGSLTLWANNDGGYGLAGSVNVFYSADLTGFYTDGTTNLTLLGNYPVSIVNSVPTVIDMGGVAAQFVKIEITSSGGSHGPLGNMDIEGAGFSEAQFAQAESAPEPASIGLLGLGLTGLLVRRRK